MLQIFGDAKLRKQLIGLELRKFLITHNRQCFRCLITFQILDSDLVNSITRTASSQLLFNLDIKLIQFLISWSFKYLIVKIEVNALLYWLLNQYIIGQNFILIILIKNL